MRDFDDEVMVNMPLEHLALAVLREVAEAEDQGVARIAVVSQGALFRQKRQSAFALAEAWQWLASHGLIAEVPTAVKDTWFATRRGREVLAEADPVQSVLATRRLALEVHPKLASARRQYAAGEYDLAAFVALREVESRVRELAGASPELVGVDLMKRAFNKTSGPLMDPESSGGRREAVMALFWGAIGVFKNPGSHEPEHMPDAVLAAEVVLLADLLHRLLDEVPDATAYKKTESALEETTQ